MYERINYFLVGLFVLLFSALVVYFGFWLAKSGYSKENYNYYIAYFEESVDGLSKDSTVKVNGVNLGRVKDIAISNRYLSKVKVTIALKKDIFIRKGMYAVLKNQGLTGLRYINIEGGRVQDSIIEPNTPNSIIETKKSIMADISQSVPKTLKKLNEFGDRLDSLLNKKNLENFSKILENSAILTENGIKIEKSLNSILSDLNSSDKFSLKSFTKIAQDLNKSINHTLKEYNSLAKSGKVTLKILNKKLPKLLNDFDKTAKKISYTTTLLNKTIKRGDYNLKRILNPAVINLKELSIEYKELADELKSVARDPASAIFNGKSVPKGPGE